VKRGMLCLSLVFACSCTLSEDYPYLAYDVRWTCISPDGCERAEQVALIDRGAILETNDSCEFWSTQTRSIWKWARLAASDSLPTDCYLLSGFVLFEDELEPSLLCHTSEGFEVELSVPNRDSPTHSQWRVEGRYTGRLTSPPR
jgi:hypothetical protein